MYDKQFSLYLDNIIARIDMQVAAYKKETNVPDIYFKTQAAKKSRLEALKASNGSIVSPDQLAGLET